MGFMSRELAAKGYGVLAINTRQNGERVNTDNFLEVRRDIEAAVYTARALGYRALVLYGHSLGNIQVQYYAANNWKPDIKAVVMTGMFGNLPWKSRNMLVQNEENYRQLTDAAFKALREGKAADVLPVRMFWITGQQVPLTGQHFLSYRHEATSTADGTYWIRRVPRPILMVRDAGDAIVQAFEPYMLLSAATSPGSLVPSAKLVVLPNPKGRVRPRILSSTTSRPWWTRSAPSWPSSSSSPTSSVVRHAVALPTQGRTRPRRHKPRAGRAMPGADRRSSGRREPDFSQGACGRCAGGSRPP